MNKPTIQSGIVHLDPYTAEVINVIALQQAESKLLRSIQTRFAEESGRQKDAATLDGSPLQQITVEACFQPADDDRHLGVHPQLAALESLVYPGSRSVQDWITAADAGDSPRPLVAPMTLLVWGNARIIPVHIRELRIVEDAFDEELNPLRAAVQIDMDVLSQSELDKSRIGTLFRAYHQQLEQLAKRATSNDLGVIGFPELPM